MKGVKTHTFLLEWIKQFKMPTLMLLILKQKILTLVGLLFQNVLVTPTKTILRQDGSTFKRVPLGYCETIKKLSTSDRTTYGHDRRTVRAVFGTIPNRTSKEARCHLDFSSLCWTKINTKTYHRGFTFFFFALPPSLSLCLFFSFSFFLKCLN